MITAELGTVDYAVSDRTRQRLPSTRKISTNRGLPEHTDFADTGCELAASCLECPLALCKYDDPDLARRGGKIMRDAEIMRLHNHGLKVSTIARTVHTSDRTVYRIIQRESSQLLSTRNRSSQRPERRRERTRRAKPECHDTSHRFPPQSQGALALN